MKLSLLCPCNSRSNGGVTTVVQQVGKSLLHQPLETSVISFDDSFSDLDNSLYGNIRMIKYNVSKLPFLKQLCWSNNLSNILKKERPDVIDCQGIWGYFSKAAYDYQKSHPGVKRIITPHGMLDQWALKNSSWKKKLVGRLFENKCLATADCIHALCLSEYKSIRDFGLTNPVAIIPNGINIQPNILPKHYSTSQRTLLFISRIHPKKGLRELIDGISILKNQVPGLLENWKIKIAGWNQLNYQEELQKQSKELGLEDTVYFIGPIFGKEKEKELRNADAFVLPSFSEGLPMSILEAWAYKLPCVMTDFCNLPEGFDSKAAIQIYPEKFSIAEGLRTLMTMSDENRIKMGENGYSLCCQKFSWDKIANDLFQLYSYLRNGGTKPDFLIID